MSSTSDFCIAYVTASSDQEAKKLASGLVKGKFVACVNLIPQVKSIYSWEGKVEESNEVLMMVRWMEMVIVFFKILLKDENKKEFDGQGD